MDIIAQINDTIAKVRSRKVQPSDEMKALQIMLDRLAIQNGCEVKVEKIVEQIELEQSNHKVRMEKLNQKLLAAEETLTEIKRAVLNQSQQNASE